MPNPEKIYARVSAAVAVLAAGLIFLPGLLELDGMQGGYALSFVALVIAVSAAVITWFFWGRATMLDRLVSGREVLAHWTYQSDEWQRYAEAELQEQTMENKWLWLVIAGWCLFFGILFWWLDPDAGGVVFLVMVGLTVFLASVAFGVPRLRYWQQQRGPGEAWVAPTAVYFDGVLVHWNSWGTRLEQVVWRDQEDGVPARLEFQVSYPARTGRQTQTVRLPIPQGREAEARVVLEHFM